MSANFACAKCSGAAVVFCTCEPGKVFLCGNCIEAHRAKPGVHMYADLDAHASIERPEDFGRYLKKTKAEGEGRKCVEEVRSVLSQERRHFEEYWNWLFSDLQRKVKAMEQAKQEAERNYAYLETEISRLVEDLARPNDSQPLKEILKSPTHLLQVSPCFYAFQPVLEACFSTGNYTSCTPCSLSDLVTGWKLQLCECESCRLVRKALAADSGDLKCMWEEICAQNPQLPPYQAEEAAVRKQLRGTLDPVYLEPLRPGMKKKK